MRNNRWRRCFKQTLMTVVLYLLLGAVSLLLLFYMQHLIKHNIQ